MAIEDDQDTEPNVKKRSRAAVWLIRLAVLLIAVFLCLTATFLIVDQWQSSRLELATGAVNPNLNVIERIYLSASLAARTGDLDAAIGAGSEIVPFIVSTGENAEEIATNLNDAGILDDRELFLDYVRYYGFDSILEAGTYRLNPQLTYHELARRLSKAVIEDVELRFLEGWRLEEMVAYLAAVNPAEIDPFEFQSIAVKRLLPTPGEYEFLSSLPEGATLEGFLFPDTYVVPVAADATDLITMMLDNFDVRLTPAMRQSIGAQGLTIFEAVILASIIERESYIPNEMPAMAGVFLNRLRDGIALQADPTVQYALGYDEDSDSWWKSPLSRADLEFDSPYNTYVINSLPLGPIANPGLSSLEAIAAPLDSPYYFFVLDCTAVVTGTHVFSTSYEEHLAHVERCR
jgi:UPF0755 protein